MPMRRLRRVAFIATLLLSVAAWAADPLDAVAQPCLAALDMVEAGSVPAENRPACAAMLAAYGAHARAVPGAVPRTSEALRDWLALVADEAARRPIGDAASLEAELAAILATIEQERRREPDSLWARIKRWLNAHLYRDRDSAGGIPDWLRWLEWISPDVLRAIGWTSFALMALTLLWILLRELHAVGALRRRSRSWETTNDAFPIIPGPAPLSLAEVARLPVGEQPAALLAFALATLRGAGRLPADDSLTNVELQQHLHGDEDERHVFGLIAGVAESKVYGHCMPVPGQVQDLILAAARFLRPTA